MTVRLPALPAPGLPPASRRALVLVVPLAVLVGVLAAVGPMGALAAGALLTVGALAVVGRGIVRVFLVSLGVLLIGYAFLGRGLAHVGVGPAYIGEMVLLLAIPAVFVALPRARFSALHGLLFLFMLWGAVCTIPYISTYGIDALRDAATWGYGFFAIAVSITVGRELVPAIVRVYRRIAFPIVLWVPVAAVLTIVFGNSLPTAPGSDVPIIFFKAGDAGVHLAGIASFVLLGLYGWHGARSTIDEIRLWIFWLFAFAVSAAINRGGMVAASMAALSGLFVRRLSRWLVPFAVALTLFASAWLVNPQVDLGIERSISFDQIVQNVTSIFSSQGATQTEATKEWRLAWWGTIIDYTFDGPYFWTGKGYGINLATSDGFSGAGSDLRAPHSTTFEVLARSGVPGLILWLSLQGAFAVAMLRAAGRARRRGDALLVALLGWDFVYWAAALVNSSFDVYIGGPQGGIWFWSLFGFGLFLMRLSREDEPVTINATEEAPAPAAPVTGRGSGRLRRPAPEPA